MRHQNEVLTLDARMLTIRLQKREWANAWRAMIQIAPVRLVADDPMYEVSPAHIELLAARGFDYEVVLTGQQNTVRR